VRAWCECEKPLELDEPGHCAKCGRGLAGKVAPAAPAADSLAKGGFLELLRDGELKDPRDRRGS
jgi:hypothetical protein